MIIETRSGRVIVVSSVSCSRSFFTALMLPCRHVVSARRHFSKPIFDANLCAERWTLAYFKSSHHIDQTSHFQQGDEQGDMSIDFSLHEVRIPTSQNAESTSQPASGAPLHEVTTTSVVKLPKKMVKQGRPKGASVIGFLARKKEICAGCIPFEIANEKGHW